jgi:Outer membrane protein beta-barrel domain
VGYRVNPYFGLGIEGGHLFSKEVDSQSQLDTGITDSRSTTENLSSTYIGPYVQGNISKNILSFYARAGAGVAIAKEDLTVNDTFTDPGITPETFNTIETQHATDLGVALALGTNIQVIPSLAVGIGIRDLMLVRHESVETSDVETPNGGTITVEDRLRARHILMPFGELIWRFSKN